MKTKRNVIILLLLVVAILAVPNPRALYEGIFFYLRDAIAYSPIPARALDPNGRYASVFDLVRLRNPERYRYIEAQLARLNLRVVRIPIYQRPDSNPRPTPDIQPPTSNLQFPTNNLFIYQDASAPLTLFSAHYDKLYDDANYQGASDNTAAVSVLLAAVGDLARRGEMNQRAFLFTGEEERGLYGAAAFVEYARTNNLRIDAIINFDNLGRGKLAIRPSAETPGFAFWLPLVGDLAYDGAALRASAAYPQPDARLVADLLRAQSSMVVYERFTARSDSNIFQANKIPTVTVSGDDMYYLQQTWHTPADRVELLNENNLDLAYELIMKYK
ncbi:MAG: M20/M25/M40 family metallo-hydrolase [Chloroflexi bacterium]|nr:M20/M25/M40 family metallo-hydrolase [Chloroflexota bacterium]